MTVSGLLKIKFGHTHIRVPKIGIPMSKTACINPCGLPKNRMVMKNCERHFDLIHHLRLKKMLCICKRDIQMKNNAVQNKNTI